MGEVSEIKNKDKLLLIDAKSSAMNSEFFDKLLTGLAELRLGFIRTLTIMRKGDEPKGPS